MATPNGNYGRRQVRVDIELECSNLFPAIHAKALPQDGVIHRIHVREPSRRKRIQLGGTVKKDFAFFSLYVLLSFGGAKSMALHCVGVIVQHFQSDESTGLHTLDTDSYDIFDEREIRNDVGSEKVPPSLRARWGLHSLDLRVDRDRDETAHETTVAHSIHQYARDATPGDQGKPDSMRQGFLGPRPYIDVTAYGARGDGLTNDTHPIQKAIYAACSKELPAGVKSGGGIYFPPGNYLISQQQSPTPTNVPDLSIPPTCSGLYFFGGNTGNRSGVVAGQTAPSSTLQVVNGLHPNGSPVFFLQQGQSGMTQGGFQSSFQNLSLNCYSQCVWIYGAAQVKMRNVGLAVATTGLADNTPLKLTDTFWFEFVDGSALQTQSAKVPVAILTGESTYGPGIAPQVGLVTFRNVITNGGGFLYDQRVSGSQPGNIIFDNVSQEQGGGSLPFLKVQAEKPCNGWGPLTVIGSGISDNNPGTPFLELSGCSFWTDITLINVTASTGGHAIQVDDGRIVNCTVVGGWFAAHSAVDTAGAPVTGCGNSNATGGWDITGPSHYGDSYYTGAAQSTNLGKFNGIPLRAGRAGDLNASVGFDSLMGVLGGPGGSTGGWDTSFARSGAQTQTLALAQADPPGSLSTALTSGGSLKTRTAKITSISNWEGSVEQVYCADGCPVLAGELITISGNSDSKLNGTVTVRSVQSSQFWSFNSDTPGDGTGGAMPEPYFYFIEANLKGAGCPASSSTGPSPEAAIAPIDGNTGVKLSWAASTGPAITGYCIWRGTASGAENAYKYVPGVSSTSYVDTGQDWAPGTPSFVNNTFPATAQYIFGLQGEGFTNSNMLGHVTLTNGRKIVTFSPAWKEAPVCMTNDQSSAGAAKAIPTPLTLTIVGGPTDVVDYLCFGNPK